MAFQGLDACDLGHALRVAQRPGEAQALKISQPAFLPFFNIFKSSFRNCDHKVTRGSQ